jgi:hypothetical protein
MRIQQRVAIPGEALTVVFWAGDDPGLVKLNTSMYRGDTKVYFCFCSFLLGVAVLICFRSETIRKCTADETRRVAEDREKQIKNNEEL